MNFIDELTVLETVVLEAIIENADAECMDCVDIGDLNRITGVSAEKLRGVISSLVKKNFVEVEEFESNFTTQYFYWAI